MTKIHYKDNQIASIVSTISQFHKVVAIRHRSNSGMSAWWQIVEEWHGIRTQVGSGNTLRKALVSACITRDKFLNGACA